MTGKLGGAILDIGITGGRLSGVAGSIPSKSVAHRALICAALADSPTQVSLIVNNEDIKATIGCLRAMGAEINVGAESVLVKPINGDNEFVELECFESGSTLRFLLPVAAALMAKSVFSGRGKLPSRPISGLKAALEQNGAEFSGQNLPFAVSGKLHAGTYNIEGDVSSQYISGLLMALPLLEGDSRIHLTSPLCSEPYVLMTMDMLSQFGIVVKRGEAGFLVPGRQTFRSPKTLSVDGDWSAAAFFLAGGAISGDVTVNDLRMDSLQGDKAVVEILRNFGAEVIIREDSVRVRKAPLKACLVDVSAIPDLFPILAVIASCAEGKTVLYNAKHLRHKESDRLKSVAAMINSLGGIVAEYPDKLEIIGTALSGGTVEAFGDHRIVMSAAIAASICGGETTIHGAEAIGKSYPGFFGDFSRLGGITEERRERQ